MHLPSSVRRQLAPETGELGSTGEGWDFWLQPTKTQASQISTQFSGSESHGARSRRRGSAKASTNLRRRPEVAWCGQYAPRTASWPIYSCSFLRLQRNGSTCTVDLKSHDSINRSRRNRCDIQIHDMVQWIFISAPLWPMPAILRTRLSRAPRRQPSYGAVGSMGATSKAFLSDWEWCA